jgi:hypothetical protein
MVLGPWSMVLGPWSMVLGPWSLVRDVRGTMKARFRVLAIGQDGCPVAGAEKRIWFKSPKSLSVSSGNRQITLQLTAHKQLTENGLVNV